MAANVCFRLPPATVVRAQEKSKSTKEQQPSLYLNKPSLIVTTQSRGKMGMRRKVKDQCVICHGSGRVNCFSCNGKGRTNCIDMEMLPKGEWPKWCRSCGGSGLVECARCLGTGEYRYIMGFRFLNQHDNDDVETQS